MCGRFASQLPPELLRRAFAAMGDIPNTQPSWSVAPTQAALVVRRQPETGERRLDALRWGLVPHFTKDLKACKRPINVRSESVASSGMFRGALASRRCLVPADAFYEWQTVPDGKQPYAIARTDGAPLAFAGLWESWRDPAGEVLRTFTIATTAANVDMAKLHARMPVILEPDDWPVWLGEEAGDYTALLRPAAVRVVRLWPVSRAVNSVRNNGAELLLPMVDPAPQTPAEAADDLQDRHRSGLCLVQPARAAIRARELGLLLQRQSAAEPLLEMMVLCRLRSVASWIDCATSAHTGWKMQGVRTTTFIQLGVLAAEGAPLLAWGLAPGGTTMLGRWLGLGVPAIAPSAWVLAMVVACAYSAASMKSLRSSAGTCSTAIPSSC